MNIIYGRTDTFLLFQPLQKYNNPFNTATTFKRLFLITDKKRRDFIRVSKNLPKKFL